LIEPKPKEPTSHQYDFDAATVYGFLKRFGLEKEARVNLEANHATLAGHSFEREIATASVLGILGSLDINRGDALLGWDTDQFPNDLWTMSMSMYHVIKAGGLGQGGCNFDAKVRRQSFAAEDLVRAHVGGVDLCARAFLTAAKLIEDGKYDAILTERYSGWNTAEGQAMLSGKLSLSEITLRAERDAIQPEPRSGKQEQIDNLLARVIYSDPI
jgi:xylose isomerase